MYRYGCTFLWPQHFEDRQEDCYTFEARLGCIAEPCLYNIRQQQFAGVVMLFVCNYFSCLLLNLEDCLQHLFVNLIFRTLGLFVAAGSILVFV